MSPEEVYEIFQKTKPKNSKVPDNIPPKIKREFYPKLSTPVADIFTEINKSGKYPRQWVKEYVTPVQKVPLPESEDQLRPISLTADLSRDYNKLLVSWLLTYIQKRMDPAQFSGTKGNSITLALILYYHFIVSNLDNVTKDRK